MTLAIAVAGFATAGAASSHVGDPLEAVIALTTGTDTTSTDTTSDAAERVLILGTTIVGGMSSPEAQRATALGFGVDIVDATQWGAMTTADFAKYRAIVLGDPSCRSSSIYAAAEANAPVWTAAVDGNVIINGTDPVFHGKTIVTNTGVGFAAAAAGRTGAYISLSCSGGSGGTPVAVLAGLGKFVTDNVPCAADVHIVATHPALEGLTDDYLSNWGCSVHEIFTEWPTDYLVLAIAQDVGDAYTASDGTTGTPYILARGEGLKVISDIDLEPADATKTIGEKHTLTATVTQDGAAVAGKTVTFTVLSGPNADLTGTADTDANGHATFTYTSSETGTDSVEATFLDVQQRTQRSTPVSVTWVEPTDTGTTTTTTTTTAPPPPPPKSNASLSVSGPGSVRTGDDATFTATVKNSGPNSATGVELHAPVPAGSTFVSASLSNGNPCRENGGTVTCFVATVDSGSSTTATIVLKATTAGPLTLTASMQADYDVNGGDNSSSATTTVLAQDAPPLPPPPPSQPGIFNAIGTGTVTINGVSHPADQVFQLNSGDVVDVTDGTLTFTTSDGDHATFSGVQPTGARQTSARAHARAASDLPAEFKVNQDATAGAVTELELVGGDFSICKSSRSLSAKNRSRVRSLWGSAKGKFRTKARYSSATVRGTIWLTEDRCDGSLTQVVESVVDVQDFVLNKTVTLTAGQSYLAQPKVVKKPAKKHAKKKAKHVKKHARPKQLTYVVRNGDSLSSIATSKLGKERRWADIAKLNSLDPPYTVQPGDTIKLPRR